ncbi:aminotransferase class V [Pseudoalteromonas phenolica]|uniref:aminotransferase class V-fold PLP-dependent enzyme n=1 Tax=Pseudoalteromonas phenolica TaxID=161398 RepID=UPI00110B40BC|nr:aminotransferase class V-fold PLP-dependent enzyme [Pseudoalteromonas phenolica]TMN91371.1 aminotransferase class V [Pseudoalteromonas phenolica]
MTEQQQLSQIYLDANATTPVLPAAAQAALETMQTQFGNPSSSHITGLQAKQIMEQTRGKARKVIGASSGQVIFTSGATEGIQTAILSALYQAKHNYSSEKKPCILYGATEHKAVPESLKHWNHILDIHAEIKAIPVDKDGMLDMDYIAKEVPNALMICTMAVNNETGAEQDLSKLEQVIRSNNPETFWMVDCVQALGKVELDITNTSIDYAPFSGHKLYAMKGIGFVYIREQAPFTPFIAGGGQESGLRSGTENLPGLASLNMIFDELLGQGTGAFADKATLTHYRAQLAEALTTAFPTIVFNNNFACSVPTTLNFAIPGFSAKEILDLFDAANIRVSSGSACSSKVTGSFVLDAMGLPRAQSEAAIRLSFGPAATQHEINDACERIAYCAKALGHSCLVNMNELDNKSTLDGLVQFKVGGSCCWLFVDGDSREAVIIEPLAELTQRLLTVIECQGLKLKAVIDTHGHADHASSRTQLLNDELTAQKTDHLGWPKHCETTVIAGHQLAFIEVGQFALVKVATPGHTEDSISMSLCHKDELAAGKINSLYTFCGDLVLMGTLGRTNFESSDTQKMYHSLTLLHSLLGNDSLLCPSHDYNNEFVTTLDAEMKRNKLLADVLTQSLSLKTFIEQKVQLDNQIHDEKNQEIMCGALTGCTQKHHFIELNKDTLQTHLETHQNVQLIDIREPHEYALNHAQQFDKNVPLTRLADFIAAQKPHKSQPLVLVCRSGSRSSVAAQALARLGFDQVAHLKGGYALAH